MQAIRIASRTILQKKVGVPLQRLGVVEAAALVVCSLLVLGGVTDDRKTINSHSGRSVVAREGRRAREVESMVERVAVCVEDQGTATVSDAELEHAFRPQK